MLQNVVFHKLLPVLLPATAPKLYIIESHSTLFVRVGRYCTFDLPFVECDHQTWAYISIHKLKSLGVAMTTTSLYTCYSFCKSFYVNYMVLHTLFVN